MRTLTPYAVALLLCGACSHDGRVVTAPVARGFEPAAELARAYVALDTQDVLPGLFVAGPTGDLGKGTLVEPEAAPLAPVKALTPTPPPPKRVPPKPKAVPPAPVPEPEPGVEPPAPPSVAPAPAPRPVVAPPPSARTERRAAPAVAAREDGSFPSTPVAVSATVGLLGLTLGATSLGGADGPINVPFAVASLGVSLVGFTTAGVFLIIDATKESAPPKPAVGVSVGPTSAVVAGSFW